MVEGYDGQEGSHEGAGGDVKRVVVVVADPGVGHTEGKAKEESLVSVVVTLCIGSYLPEEEV